MSIVAFVASFPEYVILKSLSRYSVTGINNDESIMPEDIA